MMKFVALTLLLLVANKAFGEELEVEEGYEVLFTSSPDEVSDVPMNFTGKAPTWLNGSLVRVGPGMFELGDKVKSSVTSGLDGFAKVAHWRFLGNNSVLFSTKFINSTYYAESLANNKFTANIFISPPVPALTPDEIKRSLEVGIDNMDISITRRPDLKEKNLNFLATNDIWSVYELGLENLSTLRKVTPKIDQSGHPHDAVPEFIKKLSSAHPLPEPNSESNLLNVVIEAAVNTNETSLLKLIRIKSLDQTQVIASWEIPEVPLLHSFSVTQTKAVIHLNPYTLDTTCMMSNAGNCYHWKTDKNSSLIYVVDLHTGQVQTLTIPQTFALHHINAYDENENVIVLDVATYTSDVVLSKFNLEKIRAPLTRKQFSPKADMKRIRLFLSNSTATVFSVDSPTPTSIIASTLDYPVINELNRSRSYCYVYGIVEKLDSQNMGSMGIAKKDLCQNDGHNADALYQRKGWYPSEPTFVPDPKAVDEDDGVLLVPYTSGQSKLTNLVILNARDLSFMDIAMGPVLIPQSQHGKYLDVWN